MGDGVLITEAEVRRIADLAHLDLTAEEMARMTRELGGILAYMKELAELDVSSVPPTAHVQIERLRLRDDEPGESLSNEVALAEAPRTSEGGFAVPSFVDEG
jgi:aspartyl-tRNA(Asn)/glutamyl-tRNA(Gln) amidotransferase subunit C